MKVLEQLINIYFLTFLTVLPLTYIVSTLLFFIIRNKRDYNFKTKDKIYISLLLFLNAILFIIITFFVLCYDKIVILIGFVPYYLICSILVIFTYLIISFIENLAEHPQKYMKLMSSNIKLSEYKDFILNSFITRHTKVYIFICYLVAIFLFQLEGMKIYEFANGFIRIIGTICQNTITLILAFELLLKYKNHKNKEFAGIKEGSQLFEIFFIFSIEYLKLYEWFLDEFEPTLQKSDKKFDLEISKLNQSLTNKLSVIRQKAEYNIIKISPKIKTYDIVFDMLIQSIEIFMQEKKKTDEIKSYIANMILYFKCIVQDEVVIKNRKQFLKKFSKFTNKKRYTKNNV